MTTGLQLLLKDGRHSEFFVWLVLEGAGQKEGAHLILIGQACKWQIPNWNVFVLVLGREMMCSEVWLPTQLHEVLSHFLNCLNCFLKCPNLARLEVLIVLLPVCSSSLWWMQSSWVLHYFSLCSSEFQKLCLGAINQWWHLEILFFLIYSISIELTNLNSWVCLEGE